ncbi:DNA topoisomerase [Ceratocystis pirilliformis]|uniref:DNA topoisomerase n=1 Tax=Ceratocystis pirilliformis TaxID=259994 RepID=A0ABR3Z9B2_9PEZI
MRVLCVAEKPSIAKAVAGHLSGGRFEVKPSPVGWVKNYIFDYDFGLPWGTCSVTMTCVAGHMIDQQFTGEFKSWNFPPPDSLFSAPITKSVSSDKKGVAKNIKDQAKYCQALVIWTDCDREGEHIGGEIESIASQGNPRIEVKRARFSNIERAHILAAAPLRRLMPLDRRQIEAVDARMELDLRTGYAFTRFLTNTLKPLGGDLKDRMISYGSCQFPTLGFVVDRYFRVKNFVPEPYWSIKVTHKKDNINVNFSWARVRLFERLPTLILFERCLKAKLATITKVQERPTRKFKPLPLTTVEMQKAATRMLRMTGQEAMTIAESLYNRGFISYPRTETDRFDKGMDLESLIRNQSQDSTWGAYAGSLLDGRFDQPRQGKNDDKAHPPIHPVIYVSSKALKPEEARLYEYIVRRFLACCSEDAKGMATDVEMAYGDEVFMAHGLIVHEKNYLDVYTYENWTSSTQLPRFTVGEKLQPTEAMMTDGKTSAPNYLTEADLIALMDANGVGTDATMAEHIEKIQTREYVAVIDGPGKSSSSTRGARGRGSRGGRGGRVSGPGRASAGGTKYFIPTSLGVALIQGFDRMEFETSLGKPFLRKEMELQMKDICAGKISKQAMLDQQIRQYHQLYLESRDQVETLKTVRTRAAIIQLQPTQLRLGNTF